jgi:hypothetical protein
MLSPFPPEILYEIALHLPITEDVIASPATLYTEPYRLRLSSKLVSYCKDGMLTHGKMTTIKHSDRCIWSVGYGSITSTARLYNFLRKPPRAAYPWT